MPRGHISSYNQISEKRKLLSRHLFDHSFFAVRNFSLNFGEVVALDVLFQTRPKSFQNSLQFSSYAGFSLNRQNCEKFRHGLRKIAISQERRGVVKLDQCQKSYIRTYFRRKKFQRNLFLKCPVDPRVSRELALKTRFLRKSTSVAQLLHTGVSDFAENWCNASSYMVS